MEHRRGVDGREVVGGVDGEAHVRERQAGRQAVVGDPPEVQRRKDERRRQERRGEHEHGGRKDASGPACVERAEADPSRAFTFVHEQARDQEARQDEEDVDTDEPGLGSRDPDVAEEDEQDRDAAQTLEVWPVPRIACARRRHRVARYPLSCGRRCGATIDAVRTSGVWRRHVFLARPNHRPFGGIWTPDSSDRRRHRDKRALRSAARG